MLRQTVGVRQQDIVPDFSGPTNNTSNIVLSIQHLLEQACIMHPLDMAIPPKHLLH